MDSINSTPRPQSNLYITSDTIIIIYIILFPNWPLDPDCLQWPSALDWTRDCGVGQPSLNLPVTATTQTHPLLLSPPSTRAGMERELSPGRPSGK